MPARSVNAPTTVASEFLRVAASRPVVIRGTVLAGAQGGGGSIVNWDDLVPTIPGLLVELELQISFSVTFTGTGTVSPFAPYCAWANQLTLGGAPPWPLTELTPWYLDEITDYTNYDPIYPGLGNNAAPPGPLVDMGPSPANFGTQPGTVHGAGGPFTDTFTFISRIRLQQKRSLLYGAIPMGDPENKIRNVMQLLPLIGQNPEQNLYVNCSAGATAVLASNADIKAVYHVRYIDLLPSSDTKVPLPQIGYGVQLNANSSSIQNAGQQAKYYHRDSMAYLKIMTELINNQAPVQGWYFGLWNTQEQKSARWEYDTQQNSFQTYFSDYKKTYRRYPPLGFYVADFVSGDFPEVPSVTPYNAIMSPDANYADAFDVAVTPAMTTALTVPPSTAMVGAYQRVYSKGLVGVAY